MRLTVILILLPFPAAANCILPWQTHFACNITEKNARAEFCRIADTSSNSSKHEVYYTYTVRTEPAELYFESDTISFPTKDFILEHQHDTSSRMGYVHGKMVYSFFVTQDERLDNRVREAEVSVYRSINDFTSRERDLEVARLSCDPSSITASTDLISP